MPAPWNGAVWRPAQWLVGGCIGHTLLHMHAQVYVHLYVEAHHSRAWDFLPNPSSRCPSIHKETKKSALQIPEEAKCGHMTIPKPLRGNKERKGTSPNSAEPWVGPRVSEPQRAAEKTQGSKPGSQSGSVTNFLYLPDRPSSLILQL